MDKKEKPDNKVEIEIDLSEDTLKILYKIAKKEGITIDEVAERLLREYIDAEEQIKREENARQKTDSRD